MYAAKRNPFCQIHISETEKGIGCGLVAQVPGYLPNLQLAYCCNIEVFTPLIQGRKLLGLCASCHAMLEV